MKNDIDKYLQIKIISDFLKWKKSLQLIEEKVSGHYLINYSMNEWSFFAKDEDELVSKYIKTITNG